MGRIRINIDGLSENSSSLRNYVSQLDTLNKSLASLIEEINASWEGKSCDEYIVTMKKRLSKSEEMAVVLDKLRMYIDDVINKFREQDLNGKKRIASCA